jgi:undecaprenyl-diphosphatase
MLHYIILGIIQGIFEWLPISSEGIVAITSQFMHLDVNPINIALFLHLGTLLVVLVYFWRDWKEVILLRDKKLVLFLLIATVISLLVGYPVYLFIESVAIGSILLLITGIALLITAIIHRQKIKLSINYNLLAVITGILQGLSVIPGLSRSGTTIFGLSLGEESPSKVLKMSYMMSAPVVFVSGVYTFLESPGFFTDAWIALVFSFAIGMLSIYLLIRYSSKLNFFIFCLVFGILCIVGASINFIFQ